MLNREYDCCALCQEADPHLSGICITDLDKSEKKEAAKSLCTVAWDLDAE